MDRVKGKVAIVTGAALGIGRATAIRLAKEGAKVAVTDVKDDPGGEVVTEITRNGDTASYWHLDVTDESSVRQTFIEVRERFGPITTLVNNAEINGDNMPTHDVPEEESDRVTKVNVKGVLFCTKHAIPYMREAGGGSIINLSSIYGLVAAPDFPPYHASKGAVRIMSKTDALFYASDRIRVNSVHPGYIWTPLVEELGRKSPEGLDGFRQKLNNLHPVGHVGVPDDIAHGIVYLASDESKFVTGSELVIDGGYTAR